MSDFSTLLSSFKTTAALTAAAPEAQAQRSTPEPSRRRPLTTSSSAIFPPLHKQLKNRSFNLSFLVIGGQKCGTTWAHALLQKCIHISLPSQKEVHFWDWHYHKGIDWYARQFENDKTGKHYGEITPDYMVLSPSTIAEIHRCFPNVKIIFIARDLVDRAWSAMVMELRDQNLGLKPGEFADGVIQSDERETKRSKPNVSAAQLRRMQQLACPSSQPDSYFMERLQHETHKSRSDYATSLKNWYMHFQDESILLIDYRELQTDPRGVLLQIVSHIGVKDDEAKQYVEKLNEAEIRQKVNVSTININETSSTIHAAAGNSQMDASESLHMRTLLHKQMQAYLSPSVVTFNALLKEKGYLWSMSEYKEKE